MDLETRETLKPHAQEAMKQLQERGIEVYMMSGDKEEEIGRASCRERV